MMELAIVRRLTNVTDQKLYDIANELISLNKTILKLWTVRFKLTVDQSPNGFDCSYARRFARAAAEDAELQTLVTQLKQITEQIERN